MKQTHLWTLAFALTLVAGCSPPGGGGSDAPAPVKPASKELKGNLEIVAFEGGYKLDFYEKAAKEFAEKHKDLKVTMGGDPKVWEQLRNRFIAGDVPDVTWPGWGMDYWGLVYENQLADWNAALDEPSEDGSGKWRDTFDPDLLKLGQYEGKQYMMPHHININGWWYSPKLFKDNGWTPPTTFEELLELGPKIKAKGIAPITYQGQYPYYMLYGFIFPWTISSGGIKAIDDAWNLEPGAWKSPAFLKAAQMVAELRDKGFFANGANAKNHTSSQTDFLNRKAAFLPCGTWLHSEMASVMPPDADMEFIRPPMLATGQDGKSLMVAIEPWVVPSKAKNPSAGFAFYRYMTSLDKAKEFVREKGTFTAIKGSENTAVPEWLKGAAKVLGESTTKWSGDYRLWYPKLGKEVENAMAALLAGEATPEQFCERCEAAAEMTRNDKDLPKHKVTR